MSERGDVLVVLLEDLDEGQVVQQHEGAQLVQHRAERAQPLLLPDLNSRQGLAPCSNQEHMMKTSDAQLDLCTLVHQRGAWSSLIGAASA